jgi:hypothetical protein
MMFSLLKTLYRISREMFAGMGFGARDITAKFGKRE